MNTAASARADVIIVGGGIMGCAAAFFLRRRGRSVILLERELVGRQASGANFGNVRRQGRHLHQLPLANRSREVWGRLPELIGEDVEFLPSGHIRITYDQERVGLLESYARDARDYGLELEMVSGDSMRKRFPYLGPEVRAGSLSPLDGHANPRLSAPAFCRAAARLGAQMIEHTEIALVEKEGEDFRAISTDGRVYRAPAMLITAGAWGDHLALQFGEPVPLIARGPQMGVTEPVPYGIRPVVGVSTNITEESLYYRQIPRGNIIFGGCGYGEVSTETIRAYVKPENTIRQLSQLRRLSPVLANVNLIRVWSGIESYLPDSNPVMGPSAKVPGLYYAFGFCGEGFQLGPGVGDVMAELIDTGATDVPLEHYAIGRFAAAEAILAAATSPAKAAAGTH
ncbi:FAD-binding oxidoreductase [Herbaspirillum lusitanum]|uniref:FAD-binding oxidoreductase n=1 Tax=Herbaspirillum lusitanum TaxID=213312 RepID=A0ABW9A946_9BURK